MMPRKPQRRREFGSVRKTESGRFQARYWAPDGVRRYAPHTFE
ncbi:site-specific integrase, partial [Streptomyces sp. NPDC057539]